MAKFDEVKNNGDMMPTATLALGTTDGRRVFCVCIVFSSVADPTDFGPDPDQTLENPDPDPSPEKYAHPDPDPAL
jgi:hypothetical protein